MSIKARRSRGATIRWPAVELRSGDLDVRDIRLEQAERREWSRAAGDEWRDARRLHEFLTRNTNLVEAAGLVPWGDLLPRGAVVLDAGCGSGWLAAQLGVRLWMRLAGGAIAPPGRASCRRLARLVGSPSS